MRTTMRGPFSGTVIQQLERLFQHGTTVGVTEGELLERFVRGNDDSAFEALIARHGPMVLGVCRGLLRDPNDVEDAFQATFLVLVRKAGTLRRRDLLGNWLYGVAHRVANRARALSARRAARAPFGTDALEQVGDGDAPLALDPEPIPWLHEEVRRLPEKYRVPVLLCYFEGLTHEEAARRLGWPIGTVKGRLARARDLLRRRLTRRGVELPTLALARLPDFRGVCAAVPEPLKIGTLQAARAIAGLSGASIVLTSAVSVPVTTLVHGVLRTMLLTHLKSVAMAVVAAGAVTTGLVLAAGQGPGEPSDSSDSPPAARKRIAKRRTADTVKKAIPKGAGAAPQPVAGGGGMMGGTSAGAAGGAQIGPLDVEMSSDFFSKSESPVNGMTYEARLRLSIAELGAAVNEWDKNPKNEAILKALEQPLKLSFANPTPLDDVLKFIKSSTADANGSFPIYVDPVALSEGRAEVVESKVVIDLEGVPLKTSLRLVLKQLGLAYCVRDGVLIISSVEGVREELAEAAYELMGNEKTRDIVDYRILSRAGILPLRPGGMGMGGMGGGMMGGMGGGMMGGMGGGMMGGMGSGLR